MENGFKKICQFVGDGSVKETTIDQWHTKKETIWVHVDFKNEEVKEWLLTQSNLSEIAVDALIAEDTRPRLTSIDKGILVCLRGVNCNPGSDPEDMVSLRMWMNENRIITSQHRRVEAINDIQNEFSKSEGPTNASSFLSMLIDKNIDHISNVVSDIEDKIDEIEEYLIDKNKASLKSELSAYRRTIIQLRRYIAPQRDALQKFQIEPIKWLSEYDKMHIRENGDRAIRCLEDLEATRERATIIHEEMNAKLSEQMNQTIYMMSIVATIFLPLGLLTGLLGINVGGIPGANFEPAFLIVCAILSVIAVLEYIFFKKRQVL